MEQQYEAEVDNMLRSQEKLLTQSAVLGMTGVVSPCWLPASIKYPPSCRGSCRLVMAQSAQWAEEADKNLCSPARVRGPSGRQIKPPGGCAGGGGALEIFINTVGGWQHRRHGAGILMESPDVKTQNLLAAIFCGC